MVAEVADDTEVVAATRRVETVVTASSAATTAATAVDAASPSHAITVVEVTGNTVDMAVASSDMAAATTGATTMV